MLPGDSVVSALCVKPDLAEDNVFQPVSLLGQRIHVTQRLIRPYDVIRTLTKTIKFHARKNTLSPRKLS